MLRFNGIKNNSNDTSLEQIKQDGYFPADLLFLSSTNPDGICYIEVHIILYFLFIYWLILKLKQIFIWLIYTWRFIFIYLFRIKI
jgi:hypothetical protein